MELSSREQAQRQVDAIKRARQVTATARAAVVASLTERGRDELALARRDPDRPTKIPA